jgi:hypothetical protein
MYRAVIRAEVSQWIKFAWDKLMTPTLVNTWKIIGHKIGDEEDNDNASKTKNEYN